MATERLLRGGTETENNAFTGTARELVASTDSKRLFMHDGSLAGGVAFPNHLDIQTGKFTSADAGGTVNVITLTLSTLGKAITAYAEYQAFTFKPSGNNTGAVTLNVDGKGAKAVKKNDAGSLVDLATDDFRTGIPVTVIYDGTQFIASISAAGGGGLVPLLELTASTSASLDFTSVMDNTLYIDYILKLEDIVMSATTTDMLLRFSDNNGVSYASGANNYNTSSNVLEISGISDTTYSMTADTGKTGIPLFGINSASNSDLSGQVIIDNADNDGGNQCMVKFWTHRFQTLEEGYGKTVLGLSGDVDAVQLIPLSGTITSGKAVLLGRKRS